MRRWNQTLLLLTLFSGIHAGCSGCNTVPTHSSRAPAAVASENWLFIGDSHSASAFGDGLRESLLKRGLTSEGRFFQFSVSGSTAAHWFYGSLSDLAIDYAYKIPGESKAVRSGRPKAPIQDFRTLNDEIRPSSIIIELGTNDSSLYSSILQHNGGQRTGGNRTREPASIPLEPVPDDLKHDPIGRPLSAIRFLLNANTQARCALILPPHLNSSLIPARDLERFANRMIEEGKKRDCLIVDSRLIREPASSPATISRWQDCTRGSDSRSKVLRSDLRDGIHFSRNKGEYWGQCVAALIAEEWGKR